MKENDLEAIERTLRRLVPRAVPAGLGERIVGAAVEARKGAAARPWMRAVALISAALMAVAVAGDAVISRRQDGRLAALLDGSRAGRPADDEAGRLWAEVGPELGDLDIFAREGFVLYRRDSPGGSERAYLEARERLKGMIDHEIAEDPY